MNVLNDKINEIKYANVSKLYEYYNKLDGKYENFNYIIILIFHKRMFLK